MGPYGAGWLRFVAVGKFPICLHWTFPLGGLLCALIFRARGVEILYYCFGFTALIMLHEAAHAVAARVCGLQVLAIEISGLGGKCFVSVPQTFRAAILYSSAGIIAQVVMLIGAASLILLFGTPHSSITSAATAIFGIVNCVLLDMSLVPTKCPGANVGSDGFLLRTLILNHIHGRPYRFPDTSKILAPTTQLLKLKRFVSPGFESGLEILNDNITTWDFVINALTTHLQLSPDEAHKCAMSIHTEGGILIPVPYERAINVASAITADAQANGFSLICRAVRAMQ